MMGDNMLRVAGEVRLRRQVRDPAWSAAAMGIPFYAALGNHDDPDNRVYLPFNMDGLRYYSVARGARFFFFDTNFMDGEQVRWIDDALRTATEDWKIAVFHHPIYSTAIATAPKSSPRRARTDVDQDERRDVVFSGHEHIYERIRQQKNCSFIVG